MFSHFVLICNSDPLATCYISLKLCIVQFLARSAIAEPIYTSSCQTTSWQALAENELSVLPLQAFEAFGFSALMG